jgi:hypothetical protein
MKYSGKQNWRKNSPIPSPHPESRECRKNCLQRENCRRGIASEDFLDALSLTRERVGVWVSGPLPDTRTHWRRRRLLTRGDFGRPACTLSPTLSRNSTGEGPDAGMPSTALPIGVYRQSLSPKRTKQKLQAAPQSACFACKLCRGAEGPGRVIFAGISPPGRTSVEPPPTIRVNTAPRSELLSR